MDIGTGLTVIGAKDLIQKVLGPTADYIGEGLKNFTEKRVNNIETIFQNASKKLGNNLEEDGAVPPKILKGILDEGSFCDDHLSSEYFGGVLASSRSGITRDDRGVPFIALLSRLSTYQIRTHYMIYHIFKSLFNGSNMNFGLGNEREKIKIFVPFSTYYIAMDFSQDENTAVILPHIMYGLHKENLIEGALAYGSIETLKTVSQSDKIDSPGLIIQPSTLGVELFLWAYGKSTFTYFDFFNRDNQFTLDDKINLLPNFKNVG